MSGQGSSSSDTVVRIEVYLDDASEAVSVLTAPPFRFQLDSSALEPGDHTLRVVRVDAAGGRRERRVPFHVEHGPTVEVKGLEDGATVSGRVDIDVVAPATAQRPAERVSGPSPWLYLISTIVILGGIWAVFAFVPMYGSIVSQPASTASASSGGPAPAVDQQLMKTGEQLYGSDCASCHKPSGEGMPPTFPALAGNSFLSDPAAVVKRIYDGAGSMPDHHSYTATQLAAVSTYIRNTWGNSYGGVSVDEASKAAPNAAKGGGATASSGSASSGSAPSGSASTSGPTSGGGATASSGSASSGSGSSGSASSASEGSSSAGASSASSGSAGSASGASASGSTSSSSEAMQAGKKIYTSDCQSCHQPDGSGMPPTFPALAGNSFLSDAGNVVQMIFDGKGTMPSHPSYTAKDLADVATYIRNAFGNDYGPVSVDQAKQAAPKAAQ